MLKRSACQPRSPCRISNLSQKAFQPHLALPFIGRGFLYSFAPAPILFRLALRRSNRSAPVLASHHRSAVFRRARTSSRCFSKA